MSGTDTANLVSTWVAAIIAAITMFGVVGPFLMWCASLRELWPPLAMITTGSSYAEYMFGPTYSYCSRYERRSSRIGLYSAMLRFNGTV